MNPALMQFVMDGPDPKQMEEMQVRIKAMDKGAVETFLILLDMRHCAVMSDKDVPNEFLQRQEGRKDELKDLKNSIIQALQPPVHVPAEGYTDIDGG